jgi:transcriptional regulator with XRE-family HTH domain
MIDAIFEGIMKDAKEFVLISPDKLKRWVISETGRKRLTQKEMGELLGVDQSTISKWARGKVDRLLSSTIETIAKYRGETAPETISFLLDGLLVIPKRIEDYEVPDMEARIKNLEGELASHAQLIGDLLVSVRVIGDDIKKVKQQQSQAPHIRGSSASKSVRNN